MKKIIFLLLISNFTYSQNKLPEKITKLLSFKTEKSACIIKEIKKVDKYNLITIDFIITKGYSTDHGDYLEVINNNPKLRTYILSDELFNMHKEVLSTCDICYWDIEVYNGAITKMNWFTPS